MFVILYHFSIIVSLYTNFWVCYPCLYHLYSDLAHKPQSGVKCAVLLRITCVHEPFGYWKTKMTYKPTIRTDRVLILSIILLYDFEFNLTTMNDDHEKMPEKCGLQFSNYYIFSKCVYIIFIPIVICMFTLFYNSHLKSRLFLPQDAASIFNCTRFKFFCKTV